MEAFWGTENLRPFVFFSRPHILALLTVVLAGTLLWYSRDFFKRPGVDKNARIILAVLLVLSESGINIWRIAHGTWSMSDSLPLHMCGAGTVLAVIALLYQRFAIYEIVYFWGLGGAVQAMLQPTVGEFGFPHFRAFQFFLGHGLIIISGLYLTWVGGMRPVQRSIWRVFGWTNLYLVIVAGINLLVDGNYLFICYKPPTGSLLDFFGPWPWYILTLELVAVVSFYIYYSPFAIKDAFKGKTLITQ
jgi:hypothetical integral membrane protein (TIGR02206 family)